jgi:hypothetical protein
VFLSLGGFDERIPRPAMEDVEFGYRLQRAGHRIRLAKDLQVKHLKAWDARSLLLTDLFARAVPWTELILRDGIDAGEFEQVDPHETAELIMRSCVVFTHPLVVGQCLEEGQDLEAEARASVRFLLRAITPRR